MLTGGLNVFRRTSLFYKNQSPVIESIRQAPGFHSGDLEGEIKAGSPRDILFKPYVDVPQSQLDAAILAEMHDRKIVGLTAAFISDNRVIWANGYGWSDLEKEKLVNPGTIFRIASVSKTITATALMQLWERRLFNLDDDISIYLGYLVRNPKYPDLGITFKMLLTHSSSILDFGGYEKALGSPQPPLLRELLVPGGKAYSEETWGNFSPGTRFVYSNFGIGLIGALVEMISGERFEEYAIRHIFWPLGMDASYNAADIVNFHKIAVLYKTSGGGKFYPACDYYPTGERIQRQEYKLPLGNYYTGPAGAVRTSVPDLSKFMIAHMNGGVYAGARILEKYTVDLMRQMHWYGYGLEGFFRYIGLTFQITDALAGRRLTGHAGEACGLLSDMYFDPDENTGVILMINGGYYKFLSSGYADIEEAVINTVYEKLAGPPGPVIRAITVVLNDDKVVVNGRMIFYPVPPDLIAGDLYVPDLTIADAIETTIEFDKETNMLMLTKGATVIRAEIGDARLEVNYNHETLTNQIYLKNGYIMLPLIKVSKLFGAYVNYNPAGNGIIITLQD